MPFLVETGVMQARQEELQCALFLLRELLFQFPLKPLRMQEGFLKVIDEMMDWNSSEDWQKLQGSFNAMRQLSQETVLPEGVLKELNEVEAAYDNLMRWFDLSVQKEPLGIVS